MEGPGGAESETVTNTGPRATKLFLTIRRPYSGTTSHQVRSCQAHNHPDTPPKAHQPPRPHRCSEDLMRGAGAAEAAHLFSANDLNAGGT